MLIYLINTNKIKLFIILARITTKNAKSVDKSINNYARLSKITPNGARLTKKANKNDKI